MDWPAVRGEGRPARSRIDVEAELERSGAVKLESNALVADQVVASLASLRKRAAETDQALGAVTQLDP
jgi:hypothetical protein